MIRTFVFCALVFAFTSTSLTAQSQRDLVDELDIMAVKFLEKLQILSIENDLEYCGYFGVDATGKLTVSKTTSGRRESCLAQLPPDDFDILASFHTHGAYSANLDSEVPSVDDLLGDFEEGIDGYIATPGGRIWLNLVDEEVSILLCGLSCIRPDPNFRPCPASAPKPEYTVRTLRKRERSDTTRC